jgi:hypothetical protein
LLPSANGLPWFRHHLHYRRCTTKSRVRECGKGSGKETLAWTTSPHSSPLSTHYTPPVVKRCPSAIENVPLHVLAADMAIEWRLTMEPLELWLMVALLGGGCCGL